MPDRDKTIRDLEYLISFGGASQQSMVMQIATDALTMLKVYEEERLEWISTVAKLTAEKEKLLNEQETEMCDRCGRIRLKSYRQWRAI